MDYPYPAYVQERATRGRFPPRGTGGRVDFKALMAPTEQIVQGSTPANAVMVCSGGDPCRLRLYHVVGFLPTTWPTPTWQYHISRVCEEKLMLSERRYVSRESGRHILSK